MLGLRRAKLHRRTPATADFFQSPVFLVYSVPFHRAGETFLCGLVWLRTAVQAMLRRWLAVRGEQHMEARILNEFRAIVGESGLIT